MRTRVIPVLLLQDGGLVKTKKFKNPVYVGDPINALRLLNDMEVDEVIVLDISASKNNREPDYALLADMASEAFMPIAYGGGVKSVPQMSNIFMLGAEKISLNTPILSNLCLVEAGAKQFGSQSIIASVDVKSKFWGGMFVHNYLNKTALKTSLVDFCRSLESAGAGEILLNSVDRDGMYSGYDLETLDSVLNAVSVPVVVCGGAKSLDSFAAAARMGADVAAGSLFLFSSKNGGVLINYPSQQELNTTLLGSNK